MGHGGGGRGGRISVFKRIGKKSFTCRIPEGPKKTIPRITAPDEENEDDDLVVMDKEDEEERDLNRYEVEQH